jgi:hypothetical protein
VPAAEESPPPATGHRFVASKRARQYYYCDSDPAWRDLAPANLVWFDSEALLRETYPNLVLHEPCKD